MKSIALSNPSLMLLASIFFVYYQSCVIATPVQIIRPLLVLAGLLAMLIWPAYQITRDWNWTSMLLTIFVLGIFSEARFALIIVGAAAVPVLVWALRKHPIKMDQLANLMNLVGIFLVMYYGYFLLNDLRNTPEAYDSGLKPNTDFPQLAISHDVALPDIYYIVLDGYGRADVLQEFYQFDNSEFLQFLGRTGFIVPSESRSNYPRTVLSVTSTLNMEYVQTMMSGLEGNNNWWLMSPFIDHSQVRIGLEQIGYQSVSLATDWGVTDNPSTDIYYQPKSMVLSDFEGYLLNHTPLVVAKSFLAEFAVVPSYSSHRELIQYDFETLSNIPDVAGPKFIFAHIVSPHPPFVLDSQGNSLEPSYRFAFDDGEDFQLDDQEYRKGYVEQLQYVNHQLEQVIETIIENSAVPPIILLQADHGPGMLTSFQSSAQTCLKERFANFAAYYLPGIDPRAIPRDITPVNLFRIIFNEYFGADLPLLQRSHYYYNATQIFDPEDVTDRVDSCASLWTDD